MLTTLIFLGALAYSGITCAIDNHRDMSKPDYELKNGTPVYRDRKGREYINGERVSSRLEYDEYGNSHCYKVGVSSKKIYNDSFDDDMARAREWDEKDKEKHIKWGDAAYSKYDPRFKARITTEISTGKEIAVLYSNMNKDIYRKFYHPSGRDLPLHHPKYDSMEGDWGIPISRDEYKKLNIGDGSHGHVPDYEIFNKIGTEEDPYYEESIRMAEEQKRKDIESIKERMPDATEKKIMEQYDFEKERRIRYGV